ncbi:MAG: phosphoribosylformylglycinamidine synthase subunit PurQ [bacterium]|nr:phosphoribosylformylglycinamidine synthase subunit PurQ [bacterium]
MKAGIVVFPGSNCDADTRWALELLGAHCRMLWHKDRIEDGLDLIVLPGGFSYGDYLRTGAIAAVSPVMQDVQAHVRRGGLVLGICNGFQILCESGLLPGALMTNTGLRFLCRDVHLKVERRDTPFTLALDRQTVLKLPIAHHGGRYVCSPQELDQLEEERRILFRYCDAEGRATAEANPNGSLQNIAGILGGQGNVLGMMPHPERAAAATLGSADGGVVFRSLAGAVETLHTL